MSFVPRFQAVLVGREPIHNQTKMLPNNQKAPQLESSRRNIKRIDALLRVMDGILTVEGTYVAVLATNAGKSKTAPSDGKAVAHLRGHVLQL